MKTKSAARGKNTLAVEVGNVSARGFWVLIGERELYLPFKQFSWFKEASVGKLLNVKRPHPGHLYWPDLDIDLAVDSIEHPERYPLISQRRTSRVRESSRKTGTHRSLSKTTRRR